MRPDWGGGRVRATSIELEPLDDARERAARSTRLSERRTRLARRRAGTLLEKTEGNPLFLEEVMMSMAERGEEEATERIPDTLQALIGARIDRLSPESKAVLQRASVIGRGFWGGAIEHLSHGMDGVD